MSAISDYSLLRYKPKDEVLLGDERELLDQLVVVEQKLECLKESIRMLPGGLQNPELLELCRQFALLLEIKLQVLDDLTKVPLDIDPAMYALSRACWEVNACTLAAYKR